MPEPLTQDDIRRLEGLLRAERELLVSALSDRLHQGDNPEEMALRHNALEGAVDDRASASVLNAHTLRKIRTMCRWPIRSW